jgi:uncharacterized membrane protein (UPF0127 family)
MEVRGHALVEGAKRLSPCVEEVRITLSTCVVARNFIQRLLGIYLVPAGGLLLIPNCRVIHTFGCRRPLNIAFINRDYRVVRIVTGLAAWRVIACDGAWGVIESYSPLDLLPGQRVIHDVNLAANTPKGASMVEAAIAIPILLFCVLITIQIGLLWHAKFAVSHAALVATRQASLHHGSNTAIRDGLVYGLLPLVGKTENIQELTTGLFRSGAEITQGIAMGWIRWEVLSPTRQSFLDWGEPADPMLSDGATPGEIEIPAAALPAISQRRQPRSGVLTRLDGLPVGSSSGQTLVDANNLKVYFQVGIPLRLPVVGKLLAKTLALWQGCGWSLSTSADRVGLVNFGVGTTASLLSSSVECRALAARDLSGNWQPRWPVGAAAVIQMQSNARQSVMALRDRQHYVSQK